MEATMTDDTRLEAAADQLTQILNAGCLSLMMSLGHRAGLFSTLATTGPVTTDGLATAAGLDERYVREWLGAMTVGRIVEHDPDAASYWLDSAHAALLTDDGVANIAAFAQYVPVLGGVEDDLLTWFREGGGVPYSRFPRFHEVMAADSGQTVLGALQPTILPLVPGLTERLGSGIDVLDVGCGRGLAMIQLAGAFPNSRFTGLDLSAEAIERARSDAAGLPNLEFVVADATTLGSLWPKGSFDLITTFDAIHDQGHPTEMVRGIRELLREDGVYLAQDINTSGSHHGDLDHPLGPFLYTISCMHCMTVSLAQDGEGLGAAWGVPAAKALLKQSGFGTVQVHVLPHDDQNAYYVCTP